METLKTLSRTNHYQSLKNTFDSWNKEKLVQYALSVTKAISAERENAKSSYKGNIAGHPLLRGMTLVQEIGENLSSTLDLSTVLRRLLRLVNEALDVENGSIFLIEEPSGDLFSQISLGEISAKHTKTTLRVPRGYGIAGEVAQTGIPIRIDNAQKDSRHFKKIDRNTGFLTRSILCVPLVTRNKIIGVVEIFNKKTGPFTGADEALLSAMAN